MSKGYQHTCKADLKECARQRMGAVRGRGWGGWRVERFTPQPEEGGMG